MIHPFTAAQARHAAADADRADKQAAKVLRNELIGRLLTDGVPTRIVAAVFDLTPSRIQQIARLWK